MNPDQEININISPKRRTTPLVPKKNMKLQLFSNINYAKNIIHWFCTSVQRLSSSFS